MLRALLFSKDEFFRHDFCLHVYVGILGGIPRDLGLIVLQVH